jgi:flagellar secretion chaperone FliS
MHQTAVKAYQQAEQNFLVDGTNAHGLVQILFNELVASLHRAELAIAQNDLSDKSAATTKVLSIIYVLASTLDFKRGGDIATSLAKLYDWARSNVIKANRDNDIETFKIVRKEIDDIAQAWREIAHAA